MIELLTTLLVLQPLIYEQELTSEETPTFPSEVLVYTAPTRKTENNLSEIPERDSLETLIIELMGEEMVMVAECESNLLHEKDGEIVRSYTNDVGLFQINLDAHSETAKELGIDLFSLEGNIEYAKILYDKSGTDDWYSSEHCWEKEI